MSEFFGSVWWLIVTLGVLITFHEFGHFVVARRCGVKVLRFSVGFGRALWTRRDRHGTDFVIAAIPLGGYVKMLDEREGEVAPAELDQAHNRKPVLQRIAIAAAGPAFNFIFAVAAFWAVFVIGKPDFQPVVDTPSGMAAAAGFEAGDRILSVDGEKVATWTDALGAIAQRSLDAKPTSIDVRTAAGETAVRQLPLDRLAVKGDIEKALDEIGLKLKLPSVPPVADKVRSGMPAAAAGLEDGDRILAINGVPVADFEALGGLIQKEAAKSPVLGIEVERAGRHIDFSVRAIRQGENGTSRWVTGIEAPDAHDALLREGPLAAIPAAFAETWHQTTRMLKLIGQIFTGEASTRNLSGIITIGQAANTTAHMGIAWFFDFLAAVSLSLAVMNLLPIPILDGGHLLYYLIELVKGSPVSERTQVAGQYVGLMLLVALMGLAFYNDILRIVS
ncbi:MAG TPA: RIP metalloprotease RseP [Rhodanobacteraceae bacterium]|nr:RIP metalloprotease RseP [Rhodanobacteraceae bacterium]